MLGKNRVLGSIFIVAGTAIGAGMLAMPLTMHSIGFPESLLILLLMCFFSCYSALLWVEIYQHHSPQESFSYIVQRYFGSTGKWIIGWSFLLLLYALTFAYISVGGELILEIIKGWFQIDLPFFVGPLVIVFLFGSLVILSTGIVDAANRLLFSLKIVFFFLIFLTLVPLVKGEYLINYPSEKIDMIAVLPIIFTAFGFHSCLQSVGIYLNNDYRKVRLAFVIGCLIILVLYVMWIFVMLGTFDNQNFGEVIQSGGGVSSLFLSIQQFVKTSYFSSVFIMLFSILAVLTSFLGVSLGLFDFINSNLANQTRFKSGIYTYLFPLTLALFLPKSFLFALGYASIPFSIIALIFPSLILLKIRAKQNIENEKYRVIGGTVSLIAILLLGILMIAVQLAISFGLLPNLGY